MSTEPRRAWTHSPWAGSVGAGLVGAAINLAALPVAGGGHVAFGAVASLAVALTREPGWAALAGAIAAAPLWLGQGDPFAIPLHAAEAAAVSVLCTRYAGLIPALIFWAVLGLPGTLAYLAGAGGLGAAIAWMLAVMESVNGLVNLAMAGAAARGASVRGWLPKARSAPPSLRSLIAAALVSIVALPLLLLTAIGSRLEERRNLDETRLRLHEASVALETAVDDYLDVHIQTVKTLAAILEEAGEENPEALSRLLGRTHANHPGFAGMSVTDDTGHVVARVGRGHDEEPQDAAKYDFFLRPKATGKAFVSGVERHPSAGSAVTVSAPVWSRNRFRGVVEGNLNLRRFDFVAPTLAGLRQVSVRLSDGGGHTVFAHGVERAGDVAAEAEARHGGWRVRVTQPASVARERAARQLLTSGIWGLVALLCAIPLSAVLARQLTAPLDALARRVHAIRLPRPEDIASGDIGPAPAEVRELVNGFDEMTARLASSYGAVRASLAERDEANAHLREVMAGLDEKVRERTRELLEARLRAEEASRVKGSFLANMSREIRTPMNGVLCMLSSLLQSRLDGEQRESAELAHASAESLLTILDDILDFSKIEAGRLEIEEIDFDPRRAVETAIAPLRQLAEAKGLTLEAAVDPALGSAYRGDPGRIRQVLTNLAGNAVKVTNHGKVAVKVDLAGPCDKGSLVRFEVADTGVGISRDASRRIFDPFTQADVSTTRNYGGTGLGLAISKQLVTLMGGTIDVESEEGKGSVFHFELPLAPGRMPQGRPAPALGLSRFPPGFEVLVAEDNPVNQKVTVKLLEKLGVRADVAVNGQLAVEAAARRRYHLILMDCQMPEMDGFTATREIRAAGNGWRTPIVALTAGAMAGEREKCLEAGMDDYLSKPVQLSSLTEMLAKHLPAQAG